MLPAKCEMMMMSFFIVRLCDLIYTRKMTTALKAGCGPKWAQP